MLASIIVPAFNVEAWLAQCLDSVVGQSYSDLDIVVINDGSTDSTAEIIRSYTYSDSRIRFISQENSGLSAARNRGMELAKGDVLFFLDSDDWLHPDTVLEIIGLFERHTPDIVIYQCAKYFDGTGVWSSGTDDYYWRLISNGISAPTPANKTPQLLTLYPLAQLKVLSKSFAIEHQLRFIEGIKYEDNPFHSQIFSLNPSVMFLPQRRYAWRQGRPGQITASPHVNDCIRVIDEMIRYSTTYDAVALPYQLIAITRLAVNVAISLTDIEQRRSFLQAIHDKIEIGIKKDLRKALAVIANSTIAHPADRILVLSLLQMPQQLSDAVGNSLNRYVAAGRCLLGSINSTKTKVGCQSLVTTARQWRLLYHFSKGIGESLVESFEEVDIK